MAVRKATTATTTKASTTKATAAKKATTKAATKAAPEVIRFGGRGIDSSTTLAASAKHTSKDAERIGESAVVMHGDKALTGYVVRWPHAGSDALVRLADAKGEGPAWYARCNDHGHYAAADTMQACLKLGRRDALGTWCPVHKAEAKGNGAAKATAAKAPAKKATTTKATATKATATTKATSPAARTTRTLRARVAR
jgi:hypothetical protein